MFLQFPVKVSNTILLMRSLRTVSKGKGTNLVFFRFLQSKWTTGMVPWTNARNTSLFFLLQIYLLKADKGCSLNCCKAPKMWVSVKLLKGVNYFIFGLSLKAITCYIPEWFYQICLKKEKEKLFSCMSFRHCQITHQRVQYGKVYHMKPQEN